MTGFVVLAGYSVIMVTIGVMIGVKVALYIEEKGRQEMRRSRDARD